MNMLVRVFHALRVWTGLADTSESHLTPGHGWLLPTPADARRERTEGAVDRAARRARGVRN